MACNPAQQIQGPGPDIGDGHPIDVNPAPGAVFPIAEPVTVEGDKTHNAAAPAANNVGVLPALANALPPAFTEGRQVLLSTDLAGRLRGRGDGVYSLVNTSDAALGAGGVFTGAFEFCGDYATLEVTLITGANSATRGLAVQWSYDGAVLEISDYAEFTVDFITTGFGRRYSIRTKAPFYRIVYTNGAAPTGAFRLRASLTNAYRGGEYLSPTMFRGATFRTLGNAASPQNLLTLECSSDGDIIIIRSVDVICSYTAALTAVDNCVTLSFATGPTGGTDLRAAGNVPQSRANTGYLGTKFVVRGATAADGGAATAIVAASLGAFRRAFVGRIHTAVGQTRHEVTRLLDAQDQPIYLMSGGQAILVQVINPTAANNAATVHYVVMVEFEVAMSDFGGPS